MLLFTNVWWADIKAVLGQRINFEAILCIAGVAVKDLKLVLPHISMPDMRHIDWAELHRRGFKGVVFNKDNTVTAPYTLATWPLLGSSLEHCKSMFGPDIAVFSNSAGNFGLKCSEIVLIFVAGSIHCCSHDAFCVDILVWYIKASGVWPC